MRTLSALLVLVLLAPAACSKKPDGRPAEPSARSPLAEAGDPKQKLALTPPNGTGPVDLEIRKLEAILQKKPSDSDSWAALGRSWISKARIAGDPGYYLNADACADVILARAPEDLQAQNLRALVLLNQHRFIEARDLSAKIIARNPDSAFPYAAYSDALLELGLVEDAEIAVQKMVDLKPNLPSYSRAAHLRWLHGDLVGARDLYKSAIASGVDSRDPEPSVWTAVQAAALFWNGGDDEGAEAGVALCLEKLPDYPPALVLKGKIALAKNDAKGAIVALERAFRQSPGIETAWLLGDAKALAGDDAGANAAYAHVETKGRLGDPRTLSLFWSTKKKNLPEALALAEEEKKTRGDIYTEDALAWALHRNGRDADAAKVMDHAMRLGTKDARLMFHAGAIKMALHDVEAGKKLISEATALRPGFEVTEAKEATELLR